MNDLASTSPIIELEPLTDDQIKTVIATAYKLLDHRLRIKQKTVKEKIKQLANEADIAVEFPRKLSTKTRKKADA